VLDREFGTHSTKGYKGPKLAKRPPITLDKYWEKRKKVSEASQRERKLLHHNATQPAEANLERKDNGGQKHRGRELA